MVKKIIQTRIISNQKISEKYSILKIHTPWLVDRIQPGQFVMIKAQENTTSPLLNVPLSVHDVHQDGISVLYQTVGQKTQLLRDKQAGERLTLLAPLGNGFDCAIKNSRMILVAGGGALAPLYFLAKKLKANNKQIILFFGAANKNLIVCKEKFKQLGVEVCVATDDGSEGYKGQVTSLVSQHFEVHAHEVQSMVYASGPRVMLIKLADIFKQYKLPAQLSFEAYMACGFGACFGCSVKTKQGYKLCCQDGPVFNLEDF